MSEPIDFIIRPYRPHDRQAVRDICAATCWMGEYRPDCIPDDWFWSEYWTRYFTDEEPQHTWVIDRVADVARKEPARVVGYLTGTVDARAADRYGTWLLPGVVAHVIRHGLLHKRPSRRAIWSFLRSSLRGELACPREILDRYPAMFHCDMLAEARRHGLGRQLFGQFVESMKALGVAGVHARPLSINPPVHRTLHRTGFRLAHSRPTRAFAHIESQPIEIQTWVMELPPKAVTS